MPVTLSFFFRLSVIASRFSAKVRMLMDNREQLTDKHLIIKFIYVSGMESYLKSYLDILKQDLRTTKEWHCPF